jgi:hypothetical protein
VNAAPQPKNTDTTDYEHGYNDDIIEVLEKRFPEARRQVKSFAKNFEGATLEDTARNVWQFVKNPKNINYFADGWIQKIRMPARFLADKEGDCKSFALFAAAIMSYYAPVGFRYVSYSSSNPTPSHVYCIVKKPNGGVIIIDGVWNFFNSEKSYSHKTDHWMRIMTLADNVGATVSRQDLLRYCQQCLKMRNRFAPGSVERDYLNNLALKLHDHIQGIGRILNLSDFENLTVFGHDGSPPTDAWIAFQEGTDQMLYHFASEADFKNIMGVTIQDWIKSHGSLPLMEGADMSKYKQVATIPDDVAAHFRTEHAGDKTKAQRHDLGNQLKKAWHAIKHLIAAPGRDAFLAMLDLNMMGLATKFDAAIKKNSSKVQHFWQDTLGGNFSKFQGAVNHGKGKKKLLGVDGIQGPELLALAAPIIAAAIAFLKSMGVKTDDLQHGVATAEAAFSAATGEPVPQLVDSNGELVPGAYIADAGQGADHTHVHEGFSFDAFSSMTPGVKKVLIGGGVGLAALLLYNYSKHRN